MAKIKKKLRIKQEKKLKIKAKETEKIKKPDRIKIENELPEKIIKLKDIKLLEKEEESELEELVIPQQIQNLEEDLENVPGSKSKDSDYESTHETYDAGPSTYQVQNFNDPKNKMKKYKGKTDQKW